MKNTNDMYIARFISRELAFLHANSIRAHAVMLGDNGRYWVTTLANCQRLERAGYEWA